MLYDELPLEPGQQGVDRACAHEFLKEATRLASSEALRDVGERLAAKARLFRDALSPGALPALDEAGLAALLRHVFYLRRRARALARTHGMAALREAIADLLWGEAPPGVRFERFVAGLPELKHAHALSLASELMHYADPERHWLWTHWMWDPKTRAGALPLVLAPGTDLNGESLAATYAKVGTAVAEVTRRGREEGYTAFAPEPFGTTVYLASVYAVYMYTVSKMRLSKEFAQMLPELPEFARRLLGVQQLQPGTLHV